MSDLTEDALYLLKNTDQSNSEIFEKKISANPLLTQVGTLYERLRNAMDLSEENMLLRNAIERMIKRNLLLKGKTGMGEFLIKELIWGGYLKDNSIPESYIQKIDDSITLYLDLEAKIHFSEKENIIKEWIIQFISCSVVDILHSEAEKDLIADFMFRLFRDKVHIRDDAEFTRDMQVYIAIRRAYCRDDIATLRYKLFMILTHGLHAENSEEIAEQFTSFYEQITSQLNYSLRYKIYSYIKNDVAAFYILEDVLDTHKGHAEAFVQDAQKLQEAVFSACEKRYSQIGEKVRNAIIRSIIFILVTKAIFAFGIETTVESILYKSVSWFTLILNITLPPVLMTLFTFSIHVPTEENTKNIFSVITNALTKGTLPISYDLVLSKDSETTHQWMYYIFVFLWSITFLISFGFVLFLLRVLHFNPVSQVIFIFFLALISFISFRIRSLAKMYYLYPDKQKVSSVIADFFFIPFVTVGRYLNYNIAKINVVLFVFDILIEAPIKLLFAFLEQWFIFLRTQRDRLD